MFAGAYGAPEPILYNFDGFELEPVLPLPVETLLQAIPVDPAVGFATGKINPEQPDSVAYYVSNGVYLALLLVTEEGVVLVDAPQSMAPTLVPAVKQVAGEDGVVTHMIYSHAHQDHISGAIAVVEAFPDVEVWPICIYHWRMPRMHVYFGAWSPQGRLLCCCCMHAPLFHKTWHDLPFLC